MDARESRLRLASVVWTFLLSLLPDPVLALIPEPPHVLRGLVTVNGQPRTWGTMTVRLNGSTESLASFLLGTLQDSPSTYVLQVPMDALEPRALRTARQGEAAQILLNGVVAAAVTIGERGGMQTVNLALTEAHAIVLIRGPTAVPARVDSGERSYLFAEAADTLGHAPQYQWTAACPGFDGGTFDNALTRNPVWTSPATGIAPVNCTLTVTASDGQGISTQSSTVVTVLPVLRLDPVPQILANPDPSLCGAQMTFDGRTSYHNHPSQQIALYEWDFDYDGGTFSVDASGTTAARGFGARATPVTVALRVTDNGVPPLSATATRVVHPGGVNRPPVANAGGPYGITAGGPLSLNGSGSSDPDAPCRDAIASWDWDLNGDGAYGDAAGAQPVIAWTTVETLICGGPCTPGRVYPIGLRVRDTRGASATGTSGFAVAPIPILDPLPQFVATPESSFCGEQMAFDASASRHSDPVRRIALYEWDFDYDGTRFDVEVTGATAVHGFGTLATPVTVALRVTDDAAPPRSAIATREVHPGGLNRPPAASAGGPYALRAGDALILDGSASSDPDAPCGDAIASWDWDLNGDGAYGDATGSQTRIGWSTAETLLCGGRCVHGRSYPIGLRATDTRGLTGDAAGQVAVSLLLFADDFSNGRPKGDPDWWVRSGAWSVLGTIAARRYYASDPARGGLSVARAAKLAALRTGRLETKVALTKSFAGYANGALVFGYKDNTHYRYVRLQKVQSAWKLVLGQVGKIGVDPAGVKKSKPLTALRLGSWYRLWVDVHDTGRVSVWFRTRTGTPAITYKFKAAAAGRTGYQALKARAYFDDFAAWDRGVLP